VKRGKKNCPRGYTPRHPEEEASRRRGKGKESEKGEGFTQRRGKLEEKNDRPGAARHHSYRSSILSLHIKEVERESSQEKKSKNQRDTIYIRVLTRCIRGRGGRCTEKKKNRTSYRIAQIVKGLEAYRIEEEIGLNQKKKKGPTSWVDTRDRVESHN